MKNTTVSQKEIEEKWYIIDAAGQRLGRVATIVAELLLGKNDPKVREYIDPMAHVVVINAGGIDYAQKRKMTKFYRWYSGFPGGLRVLDLESQLKKDKIFPLTTAVKGMLPKNTRGRTAFTKLRVFENAVHPHQAQKPVEINIKEVKI